MLNGEIAMLCKYLQLLIDQFVIQLKQISMVRQDSFSVLFGVNFVCS